jgi:hypothetical protein
MLVIVASRACSWVFEEPQSMKSEDSQSITSKIIASINGSLDISPVPSTASLILCVIQDNKSCATRDEES